MDYKKIKELAKERKCSTLDLIALSPPNDPFFVGMPRQIEMAHWFEQLWNDFGYSAGGKIHIRRVHYQAVSKAVLKPDNKSYGNTENDWHFLADASKYARYLQLVHVLWRRLVRRWGGRPPHAERCRAGQVREGPVCSR